MFISNADLADDSEDVVIVYADNFSDIDLRPLVAFHRRHGDPLTMVLFQAPNPRAWFVWRRTSRFRSCSTMASGWSGS